MSNAEWLESLKVGDEVGVWVYDVPVMRRIKEINSSFIITVDGAWYRRDTGVRKGFDTPMRIYLAEPTAQFREEARREGAASFILSLTSDAKLKEMPMFYLDTLAEVIKKYERYCQQ